MKATTDYELIDFGNGRKLESLAGYLVNRPSPAASSAAPKLSRLWSKVDAYFDDAKHVWKFHNSWPQDLSVSGGSFRLPLRATPFGHIGAFPEQRPHWNWLASTVASIAEKLPKTVSTGAESTAAIKALNLFAHTGGSTLAMAAAGAHVTHVDAAKPNVLAAREAARASDLGEAPIRYIIDDAMKFTAREVRRKRDYNVVVLDPPAYGHSPDGKAWRIERDLWPLLDLTLELFKPGPGAILFTGHTDGIEHYDIRDYLKQHARLHFAKPSLRFDCGRSQLSDRSGRTLDAGYYVRVTWS